MYVPSEHTPTDLRPEVGVTETGNANLFLLPGVRRLNLSASFFMLQ